MESISQYQKATSRATAPNATAKRKRSKSMGKLLTDRRDAHAFASGKGANLWNIVFHRCLSGVKASVVAREREH